MASTEKPSSCMRRMRPAEPATFQRAPCRYSSTGASARSCGSHRPCRRSSLSLAADWKSIHTSCIPSVEAAPPQLRSLGWKIHSRCFASRVAQPAVTATASARESRTGVRFMGRAESPWCRKVLTRQAGFVPISQQSRQMAGNFPAFRCFSQRLALGTGPTPRPGPASRRPLSRSRQCWHRPRSSRGRRHACRSAGRPRECPA